MRARTAADCNHTYEANLVARDWPAGGRGWPLLRGPGEGFGIVRDKHGREVYVDHGFCRISAFNPNLVANPGLSVVIGPTGKRYTVGYDRQSRKSGLLAISSLVVNHADSSCDGPAKLDGPYGIPPRRHKGPKVPYRRVLRTFQVRVTAEDLYARGYPKGSPHPDGCYLLRGDRLEVTHKSWTPGWWYATVLASRTIRRGTRVWIQSAGVKRAAAPPKPR